MPAAVITRADVERAFDEIVAAEWAQAKEPPKESPASPPDKDPRVRAVELLREAGRAGASVTDVWQRLAAEGHRTSRQTVNDWFQAGVSEGWAVQPVKRGPYVHTDHSP